MKRLSALGRADLLKLREEAGRGHGAGLDELAVWLGYRNETPPTASRPSPPPAVVSDPPARIAPEPGPGSGSADVPAPAPVEKRRLQFLVPVELETRKVDRTPRARGNPIEESELRVDWTRKPLSKPPLTRWSRASNALKHRLGTLTAGETVDWRLLVRRLGRGLPLVSLPMRERLTWATQAELWWDFTPEMHLIREDVAVMLGRLRRERGKGGLRVRVFQHLPTAADVARIPAGVPFLLISAMGQLQRSSEIQTAWRRVGRQLARRENPAYALSPCPFDRWDPELAQLWRVSLWDRWPRLERRWSSRVRRRVPADPSAADRLLDLVSPATRVSAALLRRVRFRLGPQADVGTEFDAWHRDDCRRSIETDVISFAPIPAYHDRLRRRAALTGRERDLAEEVGRWIEADHQDASVVIAYEAELRICLSGGGAGGALERVRQLLSRVVDRLRLFVRNADGPTKVGPALMRWFVGMVDRLTPEMRADPRVAEVLAEGLALAHLGLKTPHIEVPAGVDGSVFRLAKTQAASLLPEPVEYRVEFASRPSGIGLRLVPNAASIARPPIHLGELRVGSREVQLVLDDGAAATRHSFRLRSTEEPLFLPPTERLASVTLESESERIRFEPMLRPYWADQVSQRAGTWIAQVFPRSDALWFSWRFPGERPAVGTTMRAGWEVGRTPDWASRAWVDEYGVAAEFRVGNTPFVLRWIPEGSFLMGSPQDELGRYDDEGPQHRVTLSKGFWMGETPITQAQWRAVVEASVASFGAQQQRLNSAPSRFKSTEDLPVESVSWDDCNAFCELLRKLQPDGPNFGLPTEAEWEYGCRGGTTGAYHDGSPCTDPAGKDPALDRLGWFGENSGNKIQPVRRKLPNSWGLYDLHGNVWEWCRDGKRAYTETAETDPTGSMGPGTERTVRGATFTAYARFCRAASRSQARPSDRFYGRGFRLSAGQEHPSVVEKRSRGGGT